jgi:glycosyltransferase involved in cell wall biosynthesis
MRLRDGLGKLVPTPRCTEDRRVRVLTVARDIGSGVGGAEVLAYELARRLDRQRFRSYVCVTRAPEPTRRELAGQETAALREAGVEVLALDRRSSAAVLPWTRLYRLMFREQIDIVHAHMPRASVPATILARLARVPVVISHEHGSVLEGKAVRKFLDRHVVARGSDLVLAVSEWDRDNIIEGEGIAPERIKVLRNGIARPARSRDLSRSDFAPDHRPIVGAVGRLFPVKGYDDLIQAAAVLRHRGVPVRCLIAGDGPDRDRLQRVIGDLGMDDEVSLLGFREDVADLMRLLDVAVMPSHSEGGPLAMMEYMAAGVPIVGTAVGGIPELIQDGVHGLLVNPREPRELATAIERLLKDRPFAQRLSRAALERQKAEYDIDVTVKRVEDLYLQLLADSRRRRMR